ncbi:hypothetical protein OPT61_g7644 [Boeremia exigua]|uniref:Uncharacterized protein n=1 Tax=Boeremia exigua TaxID=749465 RepID=A0ACC2I1E9_9PLEO|nr:hypothetical protein OPT61_g7644 [Boeremia exigua]
MGGQKLGLEGVAPALKWKESLRGTTIQHMERYRDGAHGFRSAVSRRPRNVRVYRQMTLARASDFCSISDVGVPENAAFSKATCLGETFEATIHASVHQPSDDAD